MTLPTSGPLTLAQIGYEAKKPLLSAVNINDVELRKLCNLTSPNSVISFRDFYGTAYGVGPAYYSSDFEDALNQIPGSTRTSNTIQIRGISASGVSAAITNATHITLNGTLYAAGTLLTIKDGDIVSLSATVPSSGQISAVLSFSNGMSKTWNVGAFAISVRTIYNPNAVGTPASDQFGRATSLYGDYLLVGAPYAADYGRAYVFDVASGTLLHTLSNPALAPNDYFGISVAVHGEIAVVGAQGYVGSSGRAYVFDIVSGQLLRTLDNPNPHGTPSSDYFGYKVAVYGNKIVVSAVWEDAGSADTGAVYVFDATSGTLLHTWAGFGSSKSLGTALSIDSSRIVVGAGGAIWATDGATDEVYVFDSSSYEPLLVLENPHPAQSGATGDYFGAAVAHAGDVIAVGAYGEETNTGQEAGKVYLFNAVTGGLIKTIDNPNAYGTGTSDYFGQYLAMNETFLVASSVLEDDAVGSNRGKVYVFNAVTGGLLYTLDNPNPISSSSYCGRGVSIFGNRIVFQAGSAAGLPDGVHVYEIP